MTPFARATLALRLLALDPAGLGGIILRARAGPARDAFAALLPRACTRLHPGLSVEALTGGVDISQSLAQSRVVRHAGLLERPERLLVLPMAERLEETTAAPLCALLDRGGHRGLIALDESAEDDTGLPPALADRLAFHVDFAGLGLHDCVTPECDPEARGQVPKKVSYDEAVLRDITGLCMTLGISSLRAASSALRAAHAHAALAERDRVTADDIAVAAELVLAPRATRLPDDAPPPEPTPEEQNDGGADDGPETDGQNALPAEMLLAAIRTALPPDILAGTGAGTGKTTSGSGAGRRRIGNRRGRPLPAREGGARGAQPRVDLVATLRAAIPWQRLRRERQPDRIGPIIAPADLRYKRFEDLSDRLLVFAVDASGSAALARLAEAKGAVELLLADAYASRDHVALIAFRGRDAELLLPPTRSLVQTKRRLADLPGGGGTPLAAGLKAGLETILPAQRRGLTPVLILLTDGRGNIDLSGAADRASAGSDAADMARHIAATGVRCIVIDTGRRPEHALKDLALSLRARHVSLPQADARTLSKTVSANLAG
ncbi:hypothetical protein BOO69_19465 (plasmid) [Sulfitobacter alexandrii]|uniref:VWFA domain-containing protein n=1 Tax=Sulfitobacter alexandrii TaxID=1917485 RepID=A0A1J0WN01_9RHOB|nr:magnesium chelatase subunit D [Sulfitobacter alexandrii]APE45732.1 hypothetical protein BOO69_19465 [Sulfitobacter alexandrii]